MSRYPASLYIGWLDTFFLILNPVERKPNIMSYHYIEETTIREIHELNNKCNMSITNLCAVFDIAPGTYLRRLKQLDHLECTNLTKDEQTANKTVIMSAIDGVPIPALTHMTTVHEQTIRDLVESVKINGTRNMNTNRGPNPNTCGEIRSEIYTKSVLPLNDIAKIFNVPYHSCYDYLRTKRNLTQPSAEDEKANVYTNGILLLADGKICQRDAIKHFGVSRPVAKYIVHNVKGHKERKPAPTPYYLELRMIQKMNKQALAPSA